MGDLLTILPPCVHRGAVNGDRCACTSSRVATSTVTIRACTGEAWKKPDCPYRELTNVGPAHTKIRERTGQATDKPKDETFGLGDAVKTMLTAIGITPERVSEWTGGPCGCEERRRKLNVLGIAVKRFFTGASWASIREYLESELGK